MAEITFIAKAVAVDDIRRTKKQFLTAQSISRADYEMLLFQKML